MYFSRATLDGERISAAQLGRIMHGDQYAGHQLLWRLFSTGAGSDRNQYRPFIFRQVEDAKMPTFYLVSDKMPEDRDNRWNLEIKPYDPVLDAGSRLRFDVRVNPVKRVKQPDGRHKRHDVVMHAKQQQPDDGSAIDTRELEHQAGQHWLQSRAPRLGIRVDENHFSVTGYRQHSIHKNGRKAAIRFSTLDLHGLLEVEDPRLFQQSLFQGIGPSKSFGCGLLLVRPAQVQCV